MAWTAEVKSKEIKDGTLFVTILFSDGINEITETYRTMSNPGAKWIPYTVKSRLTQLEGVYNYDVPIGLVEPESPPIDADMGAFQTAMRKLKIAYDLVTYGIVPVDHPKIEGLKSDVSALLPAVVDKL